MNKKFILLLSISIINNIFSTTPDFLKRESPWADDVIKNLSLEEKIAQLFILHVPLKIDEDELVKYEKFIQKYPVGGIYICKKEKTDFQDKKSTNVEKQVNLINRLQVASKIPLLICQDLEYGPAMRISDGMAWPRALTLGAIQDDELIYQMAKIIGKQAKALGVHFIASPVVDINSNFKNPVINIRSFGDSPDLVIHKATKFMEGLHSEKILTCAKHFPGHGNTNQDSHFVLPTINGSYEDLLNMEILPFKEMIDKGVDVVMPGHLAVPALDASLLPATYSYNITTNFLKKYMNFEGLVMTDALIMGALSQENLEQINLNAIKAGNDLLIFAGNIPQTIGLLRYYYNCSTEYKKENLDNNKNSSVQQIDSLNQKENNLIDKENIFTIKNLNEKVYKLLKAKEWLGLNKSCFVKKAEAYAFNNNSEYKRLKKNLYRSSLTYIDRTNNISIDELRKKIKEDLIDKKEIFFVRIGPKAEFFENYLIRYFKQLKIVQQDLDKNDKLYENFPENFSWIFIAIMTPINIDQIELISNLYKKNKNIIIFLFSNLYKNLYIFTKLPKEIPIFIGYEEDKYAQITAAESLLNGNNISGKLPISLEKMLNN